MNHENLSLEEKVDLLLEYHIKSHRHAKFRMVLGIIFFLVLIILPIFGLYWFTTHFQEIVGVDPEGLKNSLNKANGILEQLP